MYTVFESQLFYQKGQIMSLVRQKLVKRLTLATLFFLIVACAGTPRPESKVSPINEHPQATTLIPTKKEAARSKALDIAHSLIGTPYRYGGTDLRGFDCSGLVQYAFNRAGVNLPRTSQEIFRKSKKIKLDELQPGDLVFFVFSSNKISHVGIYADQNQFIHSPSSGKGVSYARLNNPYWKKRLIAAGRF